MSYTFSIIFNPKPGFVIRIAMVLERRSFEIESLYITEAEESYSEMILKVKGDEAKAEQISKQIAKLIDVIYINELKEAVYDFSTIK